MMKDRAYLVTHHCWKYALIKYLCKMQSLTECDLSSSRCLLIYFSPALVVRTFSEVFKKENKKIAVAKTLLRKKTCEVDTPAKTGQKITWYRQKQEISIWTIKGV